mgnify:FL=1
MGVLMKRPIDRVMTGDRRASLASDNWSGLCPEALESLVAANSGSAPPYGQDPWTQYASDLLRETFDHDADVFFVSSGTVGNSLVLAQLLRPYQSVFCHEAAHIRLDECGAPGFLGSGIGLTPISQTLDGRMTLSDLEAVLEGPKDLRFQPPGALSLTQSTERGTLYSPAHIQSLCATAKQHALPIHMDGARFLMAATALGLSPAALSWQAGIDVLVLGASKLGGGVGDAVLFFNKSLSQGFEYRLKQAGQVSSKMRLMSAPWIGLLEGHHYQAHAAHALEMAATLESSLHRLGIAPAIPREANALFIELGDAVADGLRKMGWVFPVSYVGSIVRLMTGWDTTTATLETFIEDLGALMESASP